MYPIEKSSFYFFELNLSKFKGFLTFRSGTNYVLKKMEERDGDQYNALLQSIGELQST